MPRRRFRTLLFSLALIAALLAFAHPLRAQNSPAVPRTSVVRVSYSNQSFSTIHIPEASAIRPIRETAPDSLPSRRKWLALSLLSSGAAEFDAYSTRRSIAAGNVEANPLMRPFAGSPAIYAVIQVSPAIMDFAGFEMQRSRIPVIRRLWFIPQATGAALSLLAASHNLRISAR